MAELSLREATTIVEASLKKGRETSCAPLAVAVLDAGGHLKAFAREDGAGSFARRSRWAKPGARSGWGSAHGRWRAAWRSSLSSRLLSLDRPGRESLDDEALAEEVEDRDGDRGEDGSGHELTPDVLIAHHHHRELDRNRHRGLVGGEDQRQEELVPGQGEREDGGRDDARRRQRKEDPEQRPDLGAAVHHPLVLRIRRNAPECSQPQAGCDGC